MVQVPLLSGYTICIFVILFMAREWGFGLMSEGVDEVFVWT